MKKTKQLTEMTDRELQESITANLRIITRNSKSINGWVTFIGFMLIISIIAGIYLSTQV